MTPPTRSAPDSAAARDPKHATGSPARSRVPRWLRIFLPAVLILVWLTAAGSFAAFAAMISLPGVSQLLGCVPVGPVGWGSWRRPSICRD